MRLSRIRIENFRSIKALDFRPGCLCGLIGENNAGKSNILRALNLILGETWPSERAFGPEDFFDHDTTNEIVIEVWRDEPVQFNRNSVDLECHGLRVKVGHYKRAVKSKGKEAGDLKFDFDPLNERGEPLTGPSGPMAPGVRPRWMPVRVSGEIRDAFPLVFVDVRRDYARHTAGARWSVLSRLLAGVNETFCRSDNTVEVDGKAVPRRSLFLSRMEAAFELLRTDEFAAIESAIRSHTMKQVGLDPDDANVRIAFRPFDPLNYYKSLSLVLCEGEQEFEAEAVGAGYQSSIVVAIFRAYQELSRQGAIIAIEEPEIFLHPQRQRFFHSVLAGLAARGNQVFYTTHSAHFVDMGRPEAVTIVRRNRKTGTTVATCPPQDWAPDERERLKLAKEFDPERDEAFFAKGVVLCEGDSEKLLLPLLLRREGVDPDEIGVSIIEAGGKQSLPLFIRVLRQFSIPYVVVFDEDRVDDPATKKIEQAAEDPSRLFMLKPDLETAVGYSPGKKKVEAAMQVARVGLPPEKAHLLLKPLLRLLQEAHPASAKAIVTRHPDIA